MYPMNGKGLPDLYYRRHSCICTALISLPSTWIFLAYLAPPVASKPSIGDLVQDLDVDTHYNAEFHSLDFAKHLLLPEF